MNLIRRQAVRAVLFDPQERLLLVSCQDPSDLTRGCWWTTVGGGLEVGESAEIALRREVTEEVGIRDFELGPLLWRDCVKFRFLGNDYEQENDYYLARTTTTAIDASGAGEIEQLSNITPRWWSLPELEATSEIIYPLGLVQWVNQLLWNGPPAEPLTLS
ncbi:MAG: NUDIX hydrolase [Candidatus Dormibacteraceae bacterium]